MKKHIVKNWGEAVKQLDNTQKARKMKNPIKIILIYEDYYKSECLDELLTICRDDLELFRLILNEKDNSEINHSNQGRDLSQFFEKHSIHKNNYLYDFNIMDEWNKIKSLCEQG